MELQYGTDDLHCDCTTSATGQLAEGRTVQALVIERRLPYRVSQLIDRFCAVVGLRKVVCADGFKVKIRRLTCDEQILQNVILSRIIHHPATRFVRPIL